ncbi:uncharacterized protein METZ01_LOCUS275702 [marine metagenome]|uniref:Uncharacterized protein n=1 Tax=marine metagenome TaxID=408172 RepID=A0A382KEN3_9ZZZZ
MQAGQYDSDPDISSPDTGRRRLRGFFAPGKPLAESEKSK